MSPTLLLQFDFRRAHALRVEQRVSQTRLAHLLDISGVTQVQISQYERGQAAPSPLATARIARALGVPTMALYRVAMVYNEERSVEVNTLGLEAFLGHPVSKGTHEPNVN